SIVFAIMTINAGAILDHDIFSVVFVIVLISILFQGSLIPLASKAFNMTDNNADIMSTFSDYNESNEISFGRIEVSKDCPWSMKQIKELGLPKEMLISMIIRGKEEIVPKGHTTLLPGDKVIFCSKAYQNETEASLKEHPISKNSSWIGKTIKDHPKHSKSLVVMIKRGEETIIPDGDTILQKGDILVILEHNL
ncbi:MAG: TrkA C-terminal domain-containing protein, partial [Bacteroidia bacterium]|nr:TrkA C-terminal domain-containing protein [Bacteroidia bacterium]